MSAYNRKRNYQGEIRRDSAPLAVRNFVDKFSVQKPGEYARCLLDPENNGAVCIPDEASYPTTLFSIKQEISLGVSSGAGASGLLIKLAPKPFFQREDPATTADGAYTYLAEVGFDANTNIGATYKGSRLVAASVRVEFTGNDTNNKGLVTATNLARNFGSSELDLDDTFPTSVSIQRNYRETINCPLKDGVVLTYRPVDSLSFMMQQTSVASNYAYGNFVIHVSGGEFAASNIIAYVTLHYEGLWLNPSAAAVNVTPAITPLVNPRELAITQSVLPAFPSVFTGLEWKAGSVSKVAAAVADAIKKNAPEPSSILGSLGSFGMALGKGYVARRAGRMMRQRFG